MWARCTAYITATCPQSSFFTCWHSITMEWCVWSLQATDGLFSKSGVSCFILKRPTRHLLSRCHTMVAVMWLAESVFINHPSDLYSPWPGPFALCAAAHTQTQNSRWRRPHGPCAHAWRCACAIKIGPYDSYTLHPICIWTPLDTLKTDNNLQHHTVVIVLFQNQWANTMKKISLSKCKWPLRIQISQ